MICQVNLILFLIVCSTFILSAQENESRPWERLGLSETEWKLIQTNNISIKQVEVLLKSGVGIIEYVDKPWKNINMTEDRYIYKRRSGMTSYDIELEAKSEKDGWKNTMKTGMKSDMGNISENRELITSLVPGITQFHQKRTNTALIMGGLAAGSIAWSVAGSIVQKGKFEYIPVFFILIPDITWSVIDFRINRRKSID